jgi:hypothetical protein
MKDAAHFEKRTPLNWQHPADRHDSTRKPLFWASLAAKVKYFAGLPVDLESWDRRGRRKLLEKHAAREKRSSLRRNVAALE